jgi:Lipocalin-like domain
LRVPSGVSGARRQHRRESSVLRHPFRVADFKGRGLQIDGDVLAVRCGLPMNAGSSDALIGTWKLISFVQEVAETGERSHAMGPHPDGYLSYAKDGRMSMIAVEADRIRPREAVPSAAERAQLYDTLAAYAGTYTVEGNTVIHHVDISWNDGWTGTDQVRFFTLDGGTLTIKSTPTKSPGDGREVVWTAVWQKVT